MNAIRTRTFGRFWLAICVACAVASPASAIDVLFVSGGLPSSEDTVPISRLEALGHTVTVIADGSLPPNPTVTQDLVIVSSTVRSGRVGDKFLFTPVPLITWEAWVFDDLDLTGPQAGVDYGATSATRFMEVVGAHPLAAGRSGLIQVTTTDQALHFGVPSPTAIKVATPVGDPGRATLFAYEAGDSMRSLAAPARRVGLFLDDGSASTWTPDGEALFDAAVAWATAPLENQPPVVSAGGDSTAFRGVATTLPGVVDDDAVSLPLTVSWSKVSGPGEVVFADPSSATTDVSFDTVGSYVIELVADDGEFPVSDTATYTVSEPPPNEPPVVTVGDGSAFVGIPLALEGEVLDDGIAGPLAVAWTPISGPGTAAIAAPGQASTSVTFDAAGTYALELSADDTEFVASAVATFVVSEPPETQDALFVSSSAGPAPDDVPAVARLELLGFTVTVVAADDLIAADATGAELIVVSSTVNSGRVGDTFTSTPIPLVTWENFVYDDLGMTGDDRGSDFGLTSNEQTLDVLAGHPLAAGLSGTVTVTTQARPLRYGIPSGSAVVAATAPGEPGLATIFGYEAGDPMVVGNAPARRVGFFMEDRAPTIWTTEGIALFDAAVTWATAPATNQAPVVSAGADANAFVGVETPLQGSVVDDGLALPLTVSWTPLSGDGTAFIADPSAANTTVVFDQVGSYTLELSADDTEFVAADTVTFLVSEPPPNQAPTVTAFDGNAVVGLPVTLQGDVVDDGIAGPLVIAWTPISGPGNAAIAQPDQAVTSVSFDAPGTYEIELSADDGEFFDVDIATFVVTDPPETRNALFVSSSAGPSSDDVPAVAQLELLGFTVTVVDDNVVSAADAIDADLIVVSSTVNSGRVGDTFASIPVPLVTWENFIYDDLGMTGAVKDLDFGVGASQQEIDVLPGHPLSAGLTGIVTVTSAARPLRYGVPSGSAVVAATIPGQPGLPVIFGYGEGTAMVVGDAPARRVGFFMEDEAPSVWTAKGIALFEAAISWATAPTTNQAPAVSAGDDAAVFVGVDTPLAGSVLDDGLALPLTVGWTQLSGPIPAFIADPTAPETTARFDVIGTYVLELSADDTEFSGSDTVTFTVTEAPANQPPVVDATDGTAFVGAVTALEGSVVDDGIAGPLTLSWAPISGPGNVTFTAPDQAVTTVSFDAPGTYDLELTADDTEFIESAIATFVVTDPPPAQDVLFVSSTPDPSRFDELAVVQLELLGFVVTVVDDDVVTTADAAGMDLIVVSSTVNSGLVGSAFTATPIPIVTWETFIYDDLGMTGSAVGVDFGLTSSVTTIDAVAGHPLAAGLSGTLDVVREASELRFGVPAPSAFIAATVTGQPGLASVFGYEAGSPMVVGTAPARRVGLFMEDRSPTVWTADAVSLFNAAVAWATGAPVLDFARVLPLGNSITRGTGGFWSYRNELWSLLAADSCRVDFTGTLNGPETGFPGPGFFDRDHEGHGGIRTDEAAAELPGWLVGNAPDVALVHLGTNDVRQGAPLPAAKESLRTVIAELRASNPDVVILLGQIIPTEPVFEPGILELNGLIAELATEEDSAQSPVLLVDHYTGYDNAVLNFDDLHPNELGDAEMAGRWFTVLRPLLGSFCD